MIFTTQTYFMSVEIIKKIMKIDTNCRRRIGVLFLCFLQRNTSFNNNKQLFKQTF